MAFPQPFTAAKLLLAAALILSSPALALRPAQAAPPPEPDSPQVSALKSQLMDEVQSSLNWRTNYFTLQGQVGGLQAALNKAQNELNAASGDKAPTSPTK